MNAFRRRDVFRAAASCGALSTICRVPAVAQSGSSIQNADDHVPDYVSELQSGDPNTATEVLRFSPLNLANIVSGESKASYAARKKDFNSVLLLKCTSYLGKNREKNKDEIENFLGLFELPFSNTKDGRVLPTPFCAAGISYVAALIYHGDQQTVSTSALRSVLGEVDRYHFYPSPSVIDMKNVALGKRRWIGVQAATGKFEPRPGWLVIFNWNRDGIPDHVGLVENFRSGKITTIEFNTSNDSSGSQSNGGSIARRQRNLDYVDGFIRPELERFV